MDTPRNVLCSYINFSANIERTEGTLSAHEYGDRIDGFFTTQGIKFGWSKIDRTRN